MKQTLIFQDEKLEIPDKKGNIEIVKYKHILYIMYDKPYSQFVFTEDSKIRKELVPVSLTFIERRLPQLFFRCNPAAIISFNYLKKINYTENRLVMEDGCVFSLSRRKIQGFKERKETVNRLNLSDEKCSSCCNVCRCFQKNDPHGITK